MKEVIDTVSVALASGEVEELGGAVMQEVNRSLLSAGVNEEWADKIDNLIVLLFIIGIALLANVICRRIILRVVAKLVKQTKATWDDIVFDHKVMVHLSRMVARFLTQALHDLYPCSVPAVCQFVVYCHLSGIQPERAI